MKKVFLFVAVISLAAVSCSKQQVSDSANQPESNVMLPEPSPASSAAASESVAASGSAAAGEDNADLQKGLTLIKNQDCLTCHAMDHKVVGPSYDDIAKKYTDKDIDMLVEKIIKGGAGNWGNVPMSPHPGLSDANAKLMVEYILSLNKTKA